MDTRLMQAFWLTIGLLGAILMPVIEADARQ